MSSAASTPMPWWGWSDHRVLLPRGLARLLQDELRMPADVVTPPVARQAVSLPEPALADGLRRRLAAAAGAGAVHRDDDARLRCATGRSYLDLLALRSGVLAEAPDAVVGVRTPEHLQRVLRACATSGCAVVPFGGGTSVVGGVAPLRRNNASVIALDLSGLNQPIDVDATSMTATLQAGMRGPAVESFLQGRGCTLSHYPQSFEQATVGGMAATRSAGQASTGFGRFDEMVRGLRLMTSASELTIGAAPPGATGPSLLQLVLGSEGTLGVISDVTVRVRPLPRYQHYAGWSLPSFGDGVDALRELAQSGRLPDVTRLADAEETRASLAGAMEHAATRAAVRYLRLRGHRTPCLMVLGWEGDGGDVGARVRAAVTVLRRHGALALGSAPGRAWLRSRFEGPYLRDTLMDHAMLVETLETAATWTRLKGVREAVIRALRTSLTAAGTAPLVGCHVSHVYPEGASLYVTVLARQSATPQEQWIDAKRAATDAVVASGGLLSHHHGIGRDHAPWVDDAAGPAGIAAFQTLRTAWDPAGIMNPGKLTQIAP